jgi:hypothetical protein
MKGISKASTSASSSSHSVYNPLQTYINTFDPVSEEENIKIAVANLEEMVGEEDKKEINDEDMPDDAANISIQMGQFQHRVTPEVYPPNSAVKIVKFMWLVSSLLMSVIILMLGIMSSRLENRENNCPDLKNFNFITPRNRNNTFMNNTGNVCYSSLSLIGKEYKPIAVNLPNRDHCETIYYLGNRDYVYACRHDGDFSIVFTTADINGIDFVDIGLSWRQFCSLMFMSDRLIDDLTHIMFSV